jgi:NAD(P)H dehydrogenase (quinone)
MPNVLAVSGASGSLGRRVLAHLLDTFKVAPGRIVAGTRTPEKLRDLAARGVNVRRLDFEDPASVADGLAGVERMLLISTDAVDRPGRRLAQHTAAVEAARQAGVRHVVYTSMPQPEDSLVSFAPDHLGTERALESSGLGWTVLRNAWYMEVLLHALRDALAGGTWYTATGSGRAAPIARDDCARTAAAALVSPSRVNGRYDVTGPELLTTDEIAGIVERALKKPLHVVHVSDEQLAEGMRARGVPPHMVPFWVLFDANTRAGKAATFSDAVERLTGTPPQAFKDFLTANQSLLTSSALAAS